MEKTGLLDTTEITIISARRATLDSDEHSCNACLHSHAFSMLLLQELSRQNVES